MAQHKVFLVFVRKHHPHSLGRDCEPTITVHATLRGANNAQKTFLEADRKTKYLRKIESDGEMDEQWGRLFNKEAIFMDRTRIRVFVKGKKVDFNEYNEEDAASQNSDPFDRDSTVEPDAEDYEEIDPNLDFPLASWNPEDPMFRTRSTSLSGMNFALEIGSPSRTRTSNFCSKATVSLKSNGNWLIARNGLLSARLDFQAYPRYFPRARGRLLEADRDTITSNA
ncbi:hypothetical protein BKA61DRAFT_709128 [Leptodontidium sp. MPI-SDFR-AT-0119]|nr:hypothetical protein BKA61DRAFT_709128 [Leptodontidium sp. MPI-SDFR-AT-0119]